MERCVGCGGKCCEVDTILLLTDYIFETGVCMYTS